MTNTYSMSTSIRMKCLLFVSTPPYLLHGRCISPMMGAYVIIAANRIERFIRALVRREKLNIWHKKSARTQIYVQRTDFNAHSVRQYRAEQTNDNNHSRADYSTSSSQSRVISFDTNERQFALKSTSEMTYVKCYNCQNMNHYKRDCRRSAVFSKSRKVRTF